MLATSLFTLVSSYFNIKFKNNFLLTFQPIFMEFYYAIDRFNKQLIALLNTLINRWLTFDSNWNIFISFLRPGDLLIDFYFRSFQLNVSSFYLVQLSSHAQLTVVHDLFNTNFSFHSVETFRKILILSDRWWNLRKL